MSALFATEFGRGKVPCPARPRNLQRVLTSPSFRCLRRASNHLKTSFLFESMTQGRTARRSAQAAVGSVQDVSKPVPPRPVRHGVPACLPLPPGLTCWPSGLRPRPSDFANAWSITVHILNGPDIKDAETQMPSAPRAKAWVSRLREGRCSSPSCPVAQARRSIASDRLPTGSSKAGPACTSMQPDCYAATNATMPQCYNATIATIATMRDKHRSLTSSPARVKL